METGRTQFSCDHYERYCRQMDKEDELIDKRIGWFLTSQSILFAALGLSGNSVNILTNVISIAGVGTALFIGASIWAALLSFRRYRRVLLRVCPPEDDADSFYPQLHRSDFNVALGFVSPVFVPPLFLGVWIYVLTCAR